MTSDKKQVDEHLVKKGVVKDKVWQLTVFHRDLGDVVSRETICDAINVLEPAPECQDAVSRKAMIKEWRAAVKRVYGRPYIDSDQLVLSVMKNLPRVLPAGRSEEEIRRARDYCRRAEELALPGTQTESFWKTNADTLDWILGKENTWSRMLPVFTPPKNRKEETGGKD